MDWQKEDYRTCVNPALEALEDLDNHPDAAEDYVRHSKKKVDDDSFAAGARALARALDLALDRDLALPDPVLLKSIRATHRDLKFLKMFFWGLPNQHDSHWRDECHHMILWFKSTAELFRNPPSSGRRTHWEALISYTMKQIEQFKPLVKQVCSSVLGAESLIQHFHFEELFLDYGPGTESFIDLILHNLGVLNSSFDLVHPAKYHFLLIERSFKLFTKFATQISCLACLYWIGKTDLKLLKSDMESMISEMMMKYMPYNPEVMALYLDVFKASRGHKLLVSRRFTVSYADFLLDHLIVSEALREKFVVCSSFAVDHSGENVNLLVDIFDIITCLLDADSDTPLSSHFNNCPKTNAIGFLDSVLATLEKVLDGKIYIIPMVKPEVERVQKQLELIRPIVQNKLKVLNEDEKLKDLWSRIVNVFYFAAYVIKLCTVKSLHALYGIRCLPNVIENINLVTSEIEKIEDNHIKSGSPGVELIHVSSSSSAFIGYEQDVEEILNLLLRGTKELTIICVSGMAGQGKTTLAKRMYNDSSVCYHFHEKSWCYISKECKPREVLAKIVSGCKMHESIHDVADRVRKSLKGKRYLIVLDDIWDVEVWNVVKSAFPNDANGSRILFTSRNHDLASKAESNSISHRLRPFSDEECWELMKYKLSNCDDIPGEFLEIGRQISDRCKGMPLAVALIGAVLRRAGSVLDLWKEVAINLNSYLSGEGCKDIVELSYKYLEDYLKPCFLYLGGFRRDRDISAGNLKRLWIAEGFVKENRMKLATKYLENLVSQNLVSITKSSRGGIKRCRVHHDLLYDLCIEKGWQDNFLHLRIKRNNFHHRLFSYGAYPFDPLESTCSPRIELPSTEIHTLVIDCLYPMKCEAWYKFLSNFKVLTVLDLRGYSIDTFPEGILLNIHLRHLALSIGLKEIPQSIVDLWNLETLIVNKFGYIIDVQIAETMWEMENLKHVEIIKFGLNVKDLWQSNTVATCNIEVLKGLTLEFDVKAEEFLRRFARLRKLKCNLPKNKVAHPLWFSMFGSLKKLESLHLCHSGAGYRGQLPSSINFPNNLKKLSLRGFGLPWSALSPIGKLPNLEVLKLRMNACMGTIWHLGDEEFSKLMYLELHRLRELEQIDDSGCDETPFPCLQKLILRFCYNLKKIPSSFGDICTLDTINVENSLELSTSVRQIVEHQRDMGNDRVQVEMQTWDSESDEENIAGGDIRDSESDEENIAGGEELNNMM